MCLTKFVWISFALNVILIRGHTYIKFTRLDCESKSEFTYNRSCTLKEINRYQTAAFLAIDLQKPLRDISFNIAVYTRNAVGVYTPFMINISDNFCRYMVTKKVRPFASVLLNLLAKKSNINHTCPYSGTVVVNNLYLPKNFMPSVVLRHKDFKNVWTFYEAKNLIGTTTVYMKVIESDD